MEGSDWVSNSFLVLITFTMPSNLALLIIEQTTFFFTSFTYRLCLMSKESESSGEEALELACRGMDIIYFM